MPIEQQTNPSMEIKTTIMLKFVLSGLIVAQISAKAKTTYDTIYEIVFIGILIYPLIILQNLSLPALHHYIRCIE
jgi:hypothetical protein